MGWDGWVVWVRLDVGIEVVDCVLVGWVLDCVVVGWVNCVLVCKLGLVYMIVIVCFIGCWVVVVVDIELFCIIDWFDGFGIYIIFIGYNFICYLLLLVLIVVLLLLLVVLGV
jgi:hypothetical protein